MTLPLHTDSEDLQLLLDIGLPHEHHAEINGFTIVVLSRRGWNIGITQFGGKMLQKAAGLDAKNKRNRKCFGFVLVKCSFEYRMQNEVFGFSFEVEKLVEIQVNSFRLDIKCVLKFLASFAITN